MLRAVRGKKTRNVFHFVFWWLWRIAGSQFTTKAISSTIEKRPTNKYATDKWHGFSSWHCTQDTALLTTTFALMTLCIVINWIAREFKIKITINLNIFLTLSNQFFHCRTSPNANALTLVLFSLFLATFSPQKEKQKRIKVQREWILPFHYHVNLWLLRNQARMRFPLGALNAQFYANESYCLAHISTVTRTLDTKWRPLHLLFQCRSHFHNHIIIKSNSAFGDNGDNGGAGSLKNISLTNVRIWCRSVCPQTVAPEEQPNHGIVSSLCVNFYGKSILRATTVAHNTHGHWSVGTNPVAIMSANFAYLLTARNIIFGNCLFVSTGFSSILHNDHNPVVRRKCYPNLLQWHCIASERFVIVVDHRVRPIWKSIIITCAISSTLCVGLRWV